jgi:L-threonylcarbamoyladenylate synthase
MSSLVFPLGQDICAAVKALRQGKLVGFPTETVYGLGADALNEAAVGAVFTAKERPFDHPLIVHIADPQALNAWAIDLPPVALRLAKAFWPGPLTLVLKKHPRVPAIVTGQQDTVALRMPNHPMALSLLRAFGGGIVGPSANRYQRISPTSAQDVAEELGDKLAYILEGGACAIGIESTIVACRPDGSVQLLRQGAIKPSALEAVIQSPLILSKPTASPRAPGSDLVHYAPEKPVLMRSYDAILADLMSLATQLALPSLSVWSFAARPAALSAWQGLDWHVVPQEGQLYQQQLYTQLRAFDRSAAQQLWIETPPKQEAWLAVHDRLQRASAK